MVNGLSFVQLVEAGHVLGRPVAAFPGTDDVNLRLGSPDLGLEEAPVIALVVAPHQRAYAREVIAPTPSPLLARQAREEPCDEMGRESPFVERPPHVPSRGGLLGAGAERFDDRIDERRGRGAGASWPEGAVEDEQGAIAKLWEKWSGRRYCQSEYPCRHTTTWDVRRKPQNAFSRLRGAI